MVAPIGRGPEIEERLAFDLAAEQGAYASSGQANRMAGAAVEREDEGVGEHAANGAGIDLGALRRRSSPAFLLPVSVKLAAGGVFHVTVAPPQRSSARHLCP